MKRVSLIVLLTSLVGFSFVGPNANNNNGIEPRAAGCTVSTGALILQFNNVRARIETGGILWTERAVNRAAYEVPKTADGSGPDVIYAGSLWMGGTDVNGQLRMAATKFVGDGPDFWAGPLSTFGGSPGNYDPNSPQSASLDVIRAYGDAEIIPEECNKYDQFYNISQATVIQFTTWWQCANGITDPNECEGILPPDQVELDKILNWPAHGDVSLGQDYYLAPFYDNPNAPDGANGRYDPIVDGDYPWYDLEGDVECRDDRRVTLFGDETNWWVFNDKGNIHQASGGEPIGMEIRAQAFGFTTNDEINDMTFYNYEMINRGTQTLFNTYFAQYVDADIGGALDDYVGCDVSRGLGFAYNGDLNDDGSSGGAQLFGANPPAVGVDFFEGPYQDPDASFINYPGLPAGDNPLTESTPEGALEAYEYLGIPYAGLGLGYGDTIADNERMGMRRFIYYNNAGGVQGDPQNAAQFYGFMQGFWGTSGNPHTFGDNGLTGSIPTNYMYPGDSDPAGWGTASQGQGADASAGIEWSDSDENDRRFVQLAGPFTLKPGALNNLTVGIVYGRSFNGDLLASVNAMKVADTKAQSLFDACFEILEPPLAPAVTIQELENQIVILLDGSADGTENYIREDEVNIPANDLDGTPNDRFYRFQGYQIYQMVDGSASVSDLEDISKARLVAQCDIEDGVSKLVNYVFNEQDEISEPTVKVVGEDEGIKHSFLITEDFFATGIRTLVNHKKYYYIAVSYAYNQFKEYDPNTAEGISGQKIPYLRSRRSATFGTIESMIAIPHDPAVEGDGTSFGTGYGFQPQITQVEGSGNGGNILELSQQSIDAILANGKVNQPTYASGGGPVDIKVVDPLNLKPGNYTVVLEQEAGLSRGAVRDTASWIMLREYEGAVDTIKSNYDINVGNEQLFPEWGLSMNIKQISYGGGAISSQWLTTPITSSISFADSTYIWLEGIADSDNNFSTNWIRAGSNTAPDDEDPSCDPDNWVFNPCYYYDRDQSDARQEWEGLLNGTITSFKYVGYEVYGMPMGIPGDDPGTPMNYVNGSGNEGYYKIRNNTFTNYSMENVHDVDIIITSDDSKWTRCPVLEMNDNENQSVGNADVLELRAQTSVNKNGEPVADENDMGMGWFPGYAIDVTTGKRLNMAFGENSWLPGDNGDDMIWNPTSTLANSTGQPILGGFHYIYVFGNIEDMPVYDEGKYMKEQLMLQSNNGHSNVFDACTFVAAPLLAEFKEVLQTDVTIKVRVNKPYTRRDDTKAANGGYPKYTFSITEEQSGRTGITTQLEDRLDIINVVPNPYYAYSEYEQGRIDNRIKITNLPERCNVKIFNMQGSLIRQFIKDDPLTSVEWDLTNTEAIPIASGVYIIHVEIPGVGEKVLKWFGTMRKVDLNNI
ncbi:MAG: T9SS C-terminal target domain-containing protein [Crocinitomicaceae bacterium]